MTVQTVRVERNLPGYISGSYISVDNADPTVSLLISAGHLVVATPPAGITPGKMKLFNSDGTLGGPNTNPPAGTAGVNAGTSPPAPVVDPSSSDERGALTFGTGTTPAVGKLARLTWAVPRGTTPLRVSLDATTAAAAGLGLYVTHDATGLDICAATAPAASQANTVYGVEYLVEY